MNWRRGLIRFSIVLTVLWALACLYLSMSYFAPIIAKAQQWGATSQEISSYNWSIAEFAVVGWLVGAALWWAFLYIGFWIARGFRAGEK